MHSRRQFLKKALTSTAALSSYSLLGLQLSAVSALAAEQRFADHKALVCVFLYGGNDSFNMLVPTEAADYALYQQTRQQLAYPQQALTALNIANNNVAPHSMPTAMSSVADLFNTQQLSIISNIGPLVAPVTKPQLQADPSKLPPLLFSHNSQQALWQAAGTNSQQTQGWLGRIADILQDTTGTLPMNIGVGSSDILSTGNLNRPLVLNSTGPEEFALLRQSVAAENRRFTAHMALLDSASNPLTREYRNRIISTRDNNALVTAALATMPARETVYPVGNTLAEQLRLIADMIAVQSALGQSRQVFFVGLGGWDTHDNQVEQHPALLATLSNALAAFGNDLRALGKFNDVTTVTLSEFGRTLTSNKDGTDHGWAGHQLLMGGAIRGGRIHGHLPVQAIGTNDDLGAGRIIPTTSIEQLGGALSAWLGLSDSEIVQVFPTLNRFDQSALNLFL